MKIYGIEHILYVVVFLVVTTIFLIFSKKFAKTEKAQNVIIKSVATLLFISIIASRLSITFQSNDPKWYSMLPNQYCGTSSLVLSLAVLLGKKNNNVLHFVWLIALVGGIATLAYPDFLPQNPSIWYLPTITGLLHHTISIIMVLVLIMFKQIDVTYKKWYCVFFGFTSYFAYGVFLMATFGYSDTFHMFTPILSGTPLTAWVMAPIYVALWLIIVITIEVIKRMKLSKNK